jgi:hypothetical protein
MTLDDLSAALPNGFHDAELQRLMIDYTKQKAHFIVDIWVGDMSTEQHEAYRLAEITLSGLIFWVSEPPDAAYRNDAAGGETIDIGPFEGFNGQTAVKLPPPVPDGAFANRIFLTGRNSFHYVAAYNAALVWLGNQTIRE